MNKIAIISLIFSVVGMLFTFISAITQENPAFALMLFMANLVVTLFWLNRLAKDSRR